MTLLQIVVEMDLVPKGTTLVDFKTFCEIKDTKWRLKHSGRKPYVQGEHNGKRVYLHRIIMNAKRGQEVDHINGDGLDNRRENLRFATRGQQMQNRGKLRNNKSGYKGVSKEGRKWVATILPPGAKKQETIGRYSDIVEAARAYDRKAREYHGEFARTNF